MKTIILSALALLFFACGKNEFDSYLIPQGTEDIIEVALYPNSPVLIADGKAQLTFKIRAYTEVQARISVPYYKDGVTMVRDSFFMDTTTLNADRIPEDQITIIASNGEKVQGRTFSTTASTGEMSFTCRIGDITSEPCKIKLIKPEIPEFTSIRIPVVFHILYTSDNKTISEGINAQLMAEMLERMNKVFAGTFAPSPSSLDTKITFVQAETDNNNRPLSEKGINRVDLDAAKVSEYGVDSYIVRNLIWNPQKYLNVWIYSTWNAIAENPMYVLDNGTEIAGLDLETVNDISDIEIEYPEEAGIIIPLSSVFSIKNGSSDTRLEFLFGKFFGLLETSSDDDYEGEDTDYCSDTYVPDYRPISISKPTAIAKDSKEKPIYFDSYNIMDKYTASTTISYEQAIRIRKVTDNCPLRMMRE